MQINASLGSHTLSLFGATSERPAPPTLSPETLATQAQDAAKYREVAPTDPSSTVATAVGQTGAGLQDSASAYRPSINPDFLDSTYSDPRAVEYGNLRRMADPAYSGPSYTERANGDLLGQVMLDLQSIQNNQLAVMKKEFQTRVEATIGRPLEEDERLYDFATHAVVGHYDVMLGGTAQGLENVLSFATKIGTHQTRSGLTLENRTEDERMDVFLDRYVGHAIQSINASIQLANRATSVGLSETSELLPRLTEEETNTLRAQLLEKVRQSYDAGELVVTFESR